MSSTDPSRIPGTDETQPPENQPDTSRPGTTPVAQPATTEAGTTPVAQPTSTEPGSDAPEPPAASPDSGTEAPEPPPLDDEHDDVVLVDEYAGPSLAARVGAEALGSFLLVFVLLGVTLYSSVSGVGPLAGPLAGGLALAAAVAAFGHVSGGHFIPAITLASAAAGRTSWMDLVAYWLAQVLGAVAAGATIFLTIPDTLPALLSTEGARDYFATTANQWGDESQLFTASGGGTSFNATSAFLVEALAVAILAAVALGAARRIGRNAAPLATGAAFAALLLLALPVTGGSLNPARSTASALFADSAAVGQLWLFWAAPLLGGLVAGLIYRAFAAGEDLDGVVIEDVTEVEEIVVTDR